MKIKNPKLLLISILITEGAGIIGSIFTTSSIPTWYASINKPAFNPPNWIFGPVWTTLFLLMGLALYLIWNKKGKEVKKALNIFWLHLGLNIFWSLLFFGLKNPGLAFIEILILLGLIVYLTVLFYRLEKAAGLLLLPYLAWTTFATFLNFAIWRLN